MRRTSDAGARALAVVAALVAAASAAAAQAQVQPPAVTAEQRAAAFPDVGGAHAHGMLEDPLNRSIRLDELERQDADGGDLLHWNVSAWLGHTFNRLAIRSEGERRAGATERAEVQLLYSHAVARWWDVVAGAREEYDPTPRRTSAAFGVRGIAPYRFDVEATAFVSDGGDAAARFEARYEVLVTNRLILEPRVELEWRAQADTARELGAGFATSDVGLRLRYEIRREVAPYIGLVREARHGGTADLARARGDDASDTRFVAGIRLRF